MDTVHIAWVVAIIIYLCSNSETPGITDQWLE